MTENGKLFILAWFAVICLAGFMSESKQSQGDRILSYAEHRNR